MIARAWGDTVGARVLDASVGGKLVASPQHDGHASGLEEHGLLDFLAAPAEPFVEHPRSGHVGDAEGDQAYPLLHDSNLTDAKLQVPARGHVIRAAQ